MDLKPEDLASATSVAPTSSRTDDADFETEWDAYDADDEDVCADCARFHSCEDVCGVCGAAMCFACFEMGAGVCKGPHRG